MKVLERRKTSDALREQLAMAETKAQAGDYAGSLEIITEVKAREKKNIYVLAFEKQIEQLIGLQDAHILTEEQLTDILESIPGIVERAVEESRNPGKTNGSEPRAALFDRDEGEKRAAHQWLKDQYFQHAHDHVQKGEYDHALAELRRIYIIDPSNKNARDLEVQIEALVALKKSSSTYRPLQSPILGMPRSGEPARPEPVRVELPPERPPAVASVPAAHEESVRSIEEKVFSADDIRVGGADDLEPQLVMTEEWSSPRETPHGESKAPEKEESKKGRTLLVVFVLLAIAVLGLVIFLYWKQQRTIKHVQQGLAATVAPQQDEGIIGAPVETPEQSFLVSAAEGASQQQSPEVTDAAKPKEPPATQDAAPDEKAKEPSKEPAKQPAREPAKTASSKQTKQVTEEERKPAAQPPETKLAENTPANEQPASSQPNASAPPLTPGDNPPVADRAKPEEAAPAPFIPVEKPPQIIKLERPDFSSVHVQNGTEGQVVVQVQIDQQGKAVQTKILKTTNPLLNPPVIEAVMKSQFAPGQMAAGPVVSWLTIPYRFRFTE